jgi:hypothetical protein
MKRRLQTLKPDPDNAGGGNVIGKKIDHASPASGEAFFFAKFREEP